MKILKKKSLRAFTLIEIAVSGLIISILLAGVLQSRILVRKAKLANARTQTNKSPVAAIGGLMLWYESTSKKSFDVSESDDGDTVSVWYDLNPNVETVSNNATQSTGTNQPSYKDNKINGLPAISFDGVDNFLTFTDEIEIVSNNYTIFVVEQRTDSSSANYFIGGDTTTTNGNLYLGYETNSTLTFSQYNNDYDINHSTYSIPRPLIHSYSFNFNTKNYYIDGTYIAPSSAPANINEGLVSYSGASLGRYLTNYYQGDIGEVIIFKKYLKTKERKSVEKYLGEKWGIEVS